MSPRHFVLIATPLWGHLRPLCVLAGHLARENAFVTLPTAPHLLEKVQREVAEQFESASDPALKNIRLLSLLSFNELPLDPFQGMAMFFGAFGPTYEKLTVGEAVKCKVTETTFDVVPPPTALVVDFPAYGAFLAAREVDKKYGKKVFGIAWLPGGASMTLRVMGSPAYGGMGVFGPGELMETESAKQGKPLYEVGNKLIHTTNGSVVNIPGVPPMYDYEFFPQQLAFESAMADLFHGCYKIMREVDASLMSNHDAYEGETMQAMRNWCKDELKHPLFVVGPMLRPGYATSAPPVTGNEEFATFLDAQLKRFGPKSLLYLSFGTIFWPHNTKYVEVVIDALIEKQFPFIFTTASPFAQVSPELEEKVKNSGIGMLSKWSPQQFILSHPATGWFTTHCGHGSITEALSNGVPLICWPYEADQPPAAIHLTQILRAGIELFQVRTGERGLKPPHPSRNAPVIKGTPEGVKEEILEVIERIRGQDGKEIRGNAEKLQKIYADAWSKNGSSTKEFQEFLKFAS